MPLAVRFREAMHGTWYRLDRPQEELPASFDIESEVRLVKLATSGRARFSGRLRLDGHVTDVIVRGVLKIDNRTKTISYLFEYVGDDGGNNRFVGQKDILPVHMPDGILELSAILYKSDGRTDVRPNGNHEVGRVRLRTSSPSPFLKVVLSLRLGVSTA